ncbi:MAG TPA: hypothetical protein VKG26_05970, partial [Bacteroidia bacterium]|nr:hypothetical protein [Bacteroidia bacterium]
GQKNSPINQYLLLLYSGFHISRYSGIRYGGRVGIVNNTYLQYSPMLTYYYGFNRRKSIACNFLIDMGHNLANSKTPFKTSTQLNLTYIF